MSETPMTKLCCWAESIFCKTRFYYLWLQLDNWLLIVSYLYPQRTYIRLIMKVLPYIPKLASSCIMYTSFIYNTQYIYMRHTFSIHRHQICDVSCSINFRILSVKIKNVSSDHNYSMHHV